MTHPAAAAAARVVTPDLAPKAATHGALQLSAKDAEAFARIMPNFALLTVEDGERLKATGSLGAMLLSTEMIATWDLLAADRRAASTAEDVRVQAERVTQALAAGNQEAGTWVASATSRLVEALAQRKDAVDRLLTNRRLIQMALELRSA